SWATGEAEANRAARGATAGRSHADLGVDRARALRGLPETLLLGTDEDGDLAEVLVVAHELVGLADAVEGHRAPQHRANPAELDQLVGLLGLPGVGEVRAEDLLLAHPEIADVEVEVVPGGPGADDDLA